MMHSVTFSEKVNAYMAQIDEATAEWKLDEIVEHSAWDEELTPEEYATVYGYALRKYQFMVFGE